MQSYLKACFLLLAMTPLTLAQTGLLSDSLWKILDTKQELVEYQGRFSDLRLLPRHPLAERILTATNLRKGQTLVEVLTHIRLTEQDQANLNQLELYNLLRSVSSMQGIEYYSLSYGRMRELFKTSYAVTDVKAKTATADPLVTEIPKEDEILIMQEDSSFGQNIYRAAYIVSQTDDAILLDIVNETTLRFNMLTIFEPNDLFTSMLIVPDGQGSLLFYGLIAAKVPPIPFVKTHFQESLTNRLLALRNWFKASLEKL